jgi:hypothetical protein
MSYRHGQRSRVDIKQGRMTGDGTDQSIAISSMGDDDQHRLGISILARKAMRSGPG